MRPKTCLAIAFVLLLSLALTPNQASADCTGYNNSHADEGQLPYGPSCLNTGPGCNECIDQNPSTGSGRACYQTFNDPYDIYCYYWGNPQDIQI
jgi:hypothetical protein